MSYMNGYIFRKIVFTSQNNPWLYKDLQLNNKTLLTNVQTSGLTFLHSWKMVNKQMHQWAPLLSIRKIK